ncbi:MAG: helix-turn-helix domain-containing protein [Halobacteriaceae archaeon]
MPIITEVRFAHPDGALADTLAARPELGVSVVQEASTDPDQDRYLLQFEGDAGDIEAVLEDDTTVGAVESVPEFEGQQVWSVEFAPGTELLAPRVTAADGFVLEARSAAVGEGRGWRERWLLPDREALQDIWEYARGAGFEFEVLEFRPQGRASLEYAGADAPTAEQREALVAAYEGGYFAEPREMSLAELAERLDLSPTAAAGRLRRGMKATIEMALAVDRDDR